MNPKLKLNIQRGLIYVFLGILLIITLIPIWMLLVNATRSTTEIQEGIGFWPSRFLISNYKILLSKGLDLQLHDCHRNHRC
jgi:multiple sugar transport system permease protein